MTLAATLTLGCSVTQTSTLDIATGTAPLSFLVRYAFPHGTDRDEATTFTSDNRTLAAGATDAFDLAGGLVDIFGNVVTFTRLRAILVETSSANTTILTLFRATGQPTPFREHSRETNSALVQLPPHAKFFMVTPQPDGLIVAAGTADVLRFFNNTASSINYNVVLIGAT